MSAKDAKNSNTSVTSRATRSPACGPQPWRGRPDFVPGNPAHKSRILKKQASATILCKSNPNRAIPTERITKSEAVSRSEILWLVDPRERTATLRTKVWKTQNLNMLEDLSEGRLTCCEMHAYLLTLTFAQSALNLHSYFM